MKKLRFSSRPWAKVRRQGPPGSAQAQTCCYFRRFIKLQYTQSHTSSSEFIFKSLPGDTVVKLLGKKKKSNLFMSSGIFGRSIVLSALFSDIFLSCLFNSISLYFTFTLSIPVIVQLPINCKHATILAYHDALSLH